jgi:hypothetical protein
MILCNYSVTVLQKRDYGVPAAAAERAIARICSREVLF